MMDLEFRLMAASATYPLQQEEVERLRAICVGSVDWQRFMTLLSWHEVSPVVYLNLSQHTPTLIPQPILDDLRLKAAQNRTRALKLVAELVRCAKLLASEGIAVCPLKGPLLSQQLFGDISRRSSLDLDILIPANALDTAEKLLLAHGYRCSMPLMALTPRKRKTYLNICHHVGYVHSESHIPIEMHWSIAEPHWASHEIVCGMLKRSQPVLFVGVTLNKLSDEDNIAFLQMHGSIHNWSRLKWLADVAVLRRRAPAIDWQMVVARIEQMGMQRSLAQAVLLAQRVFDLPIPVPVEKVIEGEPIARRLVEQSMRALLLPQYSVNSRLNGLRKVRYDMNLKPGLGHKLRQLSNAPFNTLDWLDVPLPDSLFPLYLLLRPFLWLRRHYIGQSPKAIGF